MKILAIIPARRGSRGIRFKNRALFRGRPLIEWTLDAALGCPSLSEIAVSSDDPIILRLAAERGVRAVRRPRRLATATAPMASVVGHLLDQSWVRDGRFSHVCLLQPTSPLRTAEDITRAVRKLRSQKARSLISVCELEHSPLKALRARGRLIEPLFGERHLHRNRQQLPTIYRQNGAIYLIEVEAFRRKRSFFAPPCVPYVMPGERSLDIDVPADLRSVGGKRAETGAS